MNLYADHVSTGSLADTGRSQPGLTSTPHESVPGKDIFALPEYPAMKPLEFSDREAIESCTRRLPTSSDHNFTSLWTWNIDETTRVARVGRNLVIELADYLTRAPLVTMIGDDDVGKASHYILDLGPGQLHLLPEFVASQLPADEFEIDHDRDMDDYVFGGASLSWAGRAFRKLRQRANNCETTLGDRYSWNDEPFFPGSDEMELFDRWAQTRGSDDSVEEEREAYARVISYGCDLSLRTLKLFDGDQLIGQSVYELLPDCALGHYSKADYRYAGIFQLKQRVLNETLCGHGVSELNLEQDAGIEGLRVHKTQLKPSRFVRKYRARSRCSALDERPVR